ncbi:PDDEXK nuclease domain-containing protein [Bremerella sp. JC817]|uniref:PDDEXK nuclease domain-containing protein n=1 Tax=Bremerella sp. JC817 TaxID=3231756 RepID=UPI00345B2618
MVDLLESARRLSARAVNSIMTATYWEVGRRIVELEQGGEKRAEYGELVVKQLAVDLTNRFGRGFSWRNLYQMRSFFEAYPDILQKVSAQSENRILQTPSAKSQDSTTEALTVLPSLSACFPLPWSHYVRLISIDDENARRFYEQEALRGGWSVRQLKRQIDSQFYQRTLLSKNKAAMLRKGEEPLPGDLVTPEEQIKDPFVLEFLDLKDEYSEHDLEEALVHKLEEFLLELGSDFAFIGRQKRLRIGDEWYRIDLLFFHRRLRCLVVIDLKIGKFTHADSGQMHMYLNYAAEHWTHDDENPPVGLILCAEHDEAVARYSLEGLPNKVMAGEYKLALPDEALLVAELERSQRELERQGITLETEAKQATGKKKAKSAKKRKSKKKS